MSGTISVSEPAQAAVHKHSVQQQTPACENTPQYLQTIPALILDEAEDTRVTAFLLLQVKFRFLE